MLAGSAAAAPGGDLIYIARAAVRSEVTASSAPAARTHSPARGVFVTIERNGRVVGCRGSLEPITPSLEQEIDRNARAAARHDPRYQPLKPSDLREYLVTVTVVKRLEPITEGGALALSPSEGLVLKSGTRTGVVLPWEGRDPATRLRWAYTKAGAANGSPCRLYRLIAERYRG